MKIQLMQSTVVPALKVILENRIFVGICVDVSICVDVDVGIDKSLDTGWGVGADGGDGIGIGESESVNHSVVSDPLWPHRL